MSKSDKSPCLEKNCSWCCNPVKIDARVQIDIPKDEHGKPIWKERNEMLKPEDQETVLLKTFDCRFLDEKTGKCSDYENRPAICRNSTCIDPKSKRTIDEQHKETIETKFNQIPFK